MTVFDWRDYLHLAERLSARQSDEAAHRTAISRAYYAAYHVAAAYARRTGLLLGRHTHERVWEAFTVASDPDLATVGRLGKLASPGVNHRRLPEPATGSP